MPDSSIILPPDGTGKGVVTSVDNVTGLHTPYVKSPEPATFYAIADRIAPAANKYIVTLFNTSSTRKVCIHRVYVFNWQTVAAVGILLEYEFRRISAVTGGTSITPIAADTADTLSSGITATHTSTGVTDSSLIRRGYASSEEVKIGALTLENSLGVDDNIALVYNKKEGVKPITLRQNQGVTIKNITSSTIGTISAVILFTDESL
jgi:hypothetical protein